MVRINSVQLGMCSKSSAPLGSTSEKEGVCVCVMLGEQCNRLPKRQATLTEVCG